MRVAVIGLGLIGGSLLRALAAQPDMYVTGYDADPAVRGMARTAAGTAPVDGRWHVAGSVSEASADADLVAIAVPFPAFAAIIDDLANSGYAGLITDVTSVKGATREVVADRWRRSGVALAGYVGGHPMAGREISGFGGSDPGLFRGRAWALALEPDETSMADWLEIARLVTGSLQARVVPVTAEEHDLAVAAVSHVPHLLAAALVRAAANNPLALALGAGSFHDGTRVAAAPPSLNAAMCGANRDAVVTALDAVFDELDAAEKALGRPDPIRALRSWFAQPAATRQAWPPAPSAPVELPVNPAVLLRLGRAGGWITDVSDDGKTVTGVRPVSP